MNLDDSSTLMSLYVSGLSNSSRIRVEVNADYRTREDPLNTQTVKWKSTIRRDDTRPNKRAREIDASLSLQFSEFQDYNLEASWKYEVCCIFLPFSTFLMSSLVTKILLTVA